MIGRNDPCFCGSGKKWKSCHWPNPGEIEKSENLMKEYWKKHGIRLKTPEEIEGMRRAGKLTAEILEQTCKAAKAGVTTNELNALANKLICDAGATAATLGYGDPPFPKSICTSLNEVICHGIPDEKPLQEGDILNIDITCILNGFYGDCSQMVKVGKVLPEKERVIEASYEALMNAIAILQPGTPISAIGDSIEKTAKAYKCSVVHQFVGHGVGLSFHENPQVAHNRNKNSLPLVPGMTFTIEPMINLGAAEAVILEDEWTACTIDGKASAQWEHTLLITEEGVEILTPWTRVC